jgi:glucose/arabinose dehydrogenase
MQLRPGLRDLLPLMLLVLLVVCLGPPPLRADTGLPTEARRIGVIAREGSGPDTLPNGPLEMLAGDVPVRVDIVKGLERPWAMAFLPDGSLLVTERPGRLRRIDAQLHLDPVPVDGVPPVLASAYKGLMDIVLHPAFDDNRLVYFTYSRRLDGEGDEDWDRLTGPAASIALARGRYDGRRLEAVEDLFVARAATSGVSAARIAFARDGTLFLSIGAPSYTVDEGGVNRVGSAREAQDLRSHAGKILRLTDAGGAPDDNPFVTDPEALPEIFALGLRNPTGLFTDPDTGALWSVEHGPLDGDEINVIRPGGNYGWPLHSYGRAYSGARTADGSGPLTAAVQAPGIEDPWLFWSPNIAPGGLSRYRGAGFPDWRGDLLVGGLQSRQLQRVVVNERDQPVGRVSMLGELGQRIREVRTGPDGLIYLLTDHDQGALMRLSPRHLPDTGGAAPGSAARAGEGK